MENCINTDLPRSHKPTNLLHISSSYNILEDDVIGEVHSSLCRRNRYDRHRILPCLGALCWTAPWAFAIWRDVCWCGLVSGRVLRWGVMCCTVLWSAVLACRRVCGRVVGWCIMWGSVICWWVVCGWCVLWSVCVHWHRYMVVVLHPCSGLQLCLPPLLTAQAERSEKSKRRHQSSEKNSILCAFSLPPRVLIIFFQLSFFLSFSSISWCYCRIQTLLKSFASLYFDPIPFF